MAHELWAKSAVRGSIGRPPTIEEHSDEVAEAAGAIWAVAGHHLKMGDPACGTELFSTANCPKDVTLALSAGQVNRLLQKAGRILESSPVPPQKPDLHFETVDDSEDGLEERVNRFAN